MRADFLNLNCSVYPGVVVVFIDWLERSEKAMEVWRAKEKEIIGLLDSTTQSVKWSKSLKVLIVLLHNETILTEMNAATDERIATLIKFVDVKNIYYFSLQDPQNSYKKLEKHIVKFTVEYYKSEIHALKKSKDVNKVNQDFTTLPKFLASHHFQMAYLQELRTMPAKALNYYMLAYGNIKDTKKIRSELDEIKTIAEFLHFKICYLLLEAGSYIEAINQFQKHIGIFKSLVTDPDLEWQHWEWLSRQYRVFGELLIIFKVNKSLGPYHNPGYYFQAAASAQNERRKCFYDFGMPLIEDPMVNELKGKITPYPSCTISPKQQYVGQNFEKIFGLEDEKRYKPLHIAVAQELCVDHPNITLTLLKIAHEYYESEKEFSRLVSMIEIDMAIQYTLAEKYELAKSYFLKLWNQYENEKWWDILTSVFQNALICAQNSNDFEDTIKYTIHLLRPNLSISEHQRLKFQQDLEQKLSTTVSKPVNIDLPYNHPLLSCKMELSEEVGYTNKPITGKLHFLSNFPSPLEFSCVNLVLSDTDIKLSSSFALKKTNILIPGPIVCSPNKPTTLEFQIFRESATLVECVSVYLFYGKPPMKDGQLPESLVQEIIDYRQEEPGTFVRFAWDTTNWPKNPSKATQKISERTSLRVLEYATNLNITLKHYPPGLVNEFYKVEIILENPMSNPILNANLIMEFKKEKKLDPFESHVDDSTNCIYIMEGTEKVQSNQLLIESIPANGFSTSIIYILQSSTSNEKHLEVKVKYETEKYAATDMKKVQIPFRHPFKMVVDFYSEDLELLSIDPKLQPSAKNSFLIGLETIPMTPFPINLLDITLYINKGSNQESIASFFGTQIPRNGAVIDKSNKYFTWFKLDSHLMGAVKLGYVVVSWIRKFSGSDDRPCQTNYQIPMLEISSSKIEADITLPPYGQIGQPFTFSLHLTNKSPLSQEIEIKLHEVDQLLMGGLKRTVLTINPTQKSSLHWNFVPISSGWIALPRIDVITPRNGLNLMGKEPAHIFVQPGLIGVPQF
uniref:Trafficking protein particle complex subunit 11 domain-containing protein n=1 Tax=Arcella intermedia TaxID=1963864 RepID=A0A6B2KXB0_9EUKA